MTDDPPVDLVPYTSADDLVEHVYPPALVTAIGGWLHEKFGRSGSERTRTTYGQLLANYRAWLVRSGLDLDAPPHKARMLALAAQQWAGTSADGTAGVGPATYNQRLAVLSSFFGYAARMGLIPDGNPIASYVQRRPVEAYADVRYIEPTAIKAALGQIDRSTAHGKRDYALLAVGLSTGRRVAELAGLRWGDVSTDGKAVRLTWRRCKGGKVMHDTLAQSSAAALLDWLHSHYGAQLGTLASDAPIWVTLAARGRGGALSGQAIADVCQKRIGTSKVHQLRHTFAHAMVEKGAKVTDVQQRLGHANAATTGIYLQKLASADNPLADDLADLFGI